MEKLLKLTSSAKSSQLCVLSAVICTKITHMPCK